MTTQTMKSKTKVTRITIGRLYNLGNYEHVRYELTVEVGEGRSAALALRNTMKILRAANPKPPVSSFDHESAVKRLADPEAWHKNIEPESARKKAIKETVSQAKETVKRHDQWIARRKVAEMMLDDIGAARVFKDAKLSWGDEEDDWG